MVTSNELVTFPYSRLSLLSLLYNIDHVLNLVCNYHQ